MEDHADGPMIVRSTKMGGFVRVNAAFAERVGMVADELKEQTFVDWIEECDRPLFLLAVTEGKEGCRVRHKSKAGPALELEVRIRNRGDEVFVLAREFDPEVEADKEEDCNTQPTIKSTLRKIALIVEEQNPKYRCSILLVANGRFVKGAGPSLPDSYNNAIDGFAIGPHVGSCGTAIYWNVPVIVPDIQKDPLWVPFAKLAKEAGVAACWSHPFSNQQGRVLGALALYSPEPRKPTPTQLSALRAAAQMTGLAVERGRAEEEVRKANQVKALFMANMSHEIRTPLNALIGITHYLEDLPGTTLRNEIRMLRDAGEQLLNLFAGVLELTEVRDRRGNDKVIDLRECCYEIIEAFESVSQAKGIILEFDLSDSVPRWASVDAWALKRVLRLLVDNAVKFTKEGQVAIAVKFESEVLQVRVSDTGCGIDLDRLAELREPFVQGDLSSTKQYAGFGLGLTLSDLCLQALGGRIEFAANEPQGTVVSFKVPVTVAEAPALPPSTSSSPAVASAELPILVVEDNRLNGKVIERILTGAGYQCHISENGELALQALSEHAYCCILMDCQMPVMDGYEATRRIREAEAGTGRHVPIIAVTANALAEDRARCLESGMDEYVKKPVRKQELSGLLERYVGKPSQTA